MRMSSMSALFLSAALGATLSASAATSPWQPLPDTAPAPADNPTTPAKVELGKHDSAKVGAVVNSGTGRSYASEFFVPRILAGRFDEGYPMKDAYKDLVSAAELGAAHCIPMPVLAAATATYQAALRQGHGDKGKGGMIRVYEDLLGVLFRDAAQPDNTTEGRA